MHIIIMNANKTNYSLITFSLLIKLLKSVEEYKVNSVHSLIAVGRKEW